LSVPCQRYRRVFGDGPKGADSPISPIFEGDRTFPCVPVSMSDSWKRSFRHRRQQPVVSTTRATATNGRERARPTRSRHGAEQRAAVETDGS